ncbi:MAG: hypothetical protein IJY93_04170 [Clostridia bacterium]|nr:hypothetical protein [Clostridia bacterium]
MSVRYDLPKYSDGYRKRTIDSFGGYDHREGTEDGSIWHMENMSGDCYPLAAPRVPRVISRTLTKPNGIAGYDGLYWVDGTGFYDKGEFKGTVSDSFKRFVFLGRYLVILPDKCYYNTETGEFGSLEASWSGTASFSDGTYMGEDAEGCRIVTSGTVFPFKVGDAVTIEGATVADNNKTIIIREISDDKKSLGFYEHSFTVANSQTLTISRTVPDMDFICQNENRLWGCKGDTIYASKLGDAFNWNVFDGLATDSYALDVGSAGDFTGCIAYGGYAIFFKEDQVYKVYGDKPTNFKAMASASLGVMRGSADSLAIAGETLYYLSRCGVMAYTGGIPVAISSVFGDVSYCDAVGGSDGLKYYISMRDSVSGEYSLFCYDTRIRRWYREDDTRAVGFCYYDGLRLLGSDGVMYRIGAWRDHEDGQVSEDVFKSVIEFGDITDGTMDRKHLCKIQLRLDLDVGAKVLVYMSFNGGRYSLVKEIRSDRKNSYYLPLSLHRYDHCRIKLEGFGDWKLCSLAREFSPGSEL